MYKLEELQKYTAINPSKSELFEKHLQAQLEEYESVASIITKEYAVDERDKILEDIATAKKAINETVTLSLQGKHSYAFLKLLKYIQHHLPRQCHENTGNYFFRMRVFDDKRSRDANELFHIPFDKLGKTTTQRYSTPGLPCLYLGTSLYGCWEELGRPPLYSCMFSELTNTKNFLLWDFRVPETIDDLGDLKKLLTTMPIIISCSIKVKYPEDNFKPEYIIPQFMLESLLISRELFDGIKTIGIKYKSVLTNDDFEFPISKNDNIVIPAIRTDKKYDESLCELFKITKPTCEEFEKIKFRPLIINGGAAYEGIDKYKNSLFGNMETFISDIETFPLLDIENEPLENDNNS